MTGWGIEHGPVVIGVAYVFGVDPANVCGSSWREHERCVVMGEGACTGLRPGVSAGDEAGEGDAG